MKKYLTGVLALAIAISAFAFTRAPKKMINGKPVITAADPCADANKQWWIINIECSGQSLSVIRNPGYYTLSDIQEVSALCAGEQCVCAIYACPVAGGNSPVISQGTTIYTALTNFFNTGMTSPFIVTKDQYAGRR